MTTPEAIFLLAMGDAQEGYLIQGVIQQLGFLNITRVYDGAQVVQVMTKVSPDFVVGAWELPGYGGLRLVKEIRARFGDTRPCLLVVPEYPENERNIAQGAGVSDFLVRPLTVAATKAKLQDWISQKNQPTALEQEEKAADKLVEGGRWKEALVQYDRALSVGRKQMSGLQTELGLTLKKLGRMDEAIDVLEKAVQAFPDLARAQAALGEAYLDAGRLFEAGQVLSRAARLDPGQQNIFRLLDEVNRQNEQAGRDEEALRTRLAEKPDDPYLLNRLGIMLRKQGKYGEAAAAYLRAIKSLGPNQNLYYNLAKACYEGGQIKSAISALKAALKIEPPLEKAQQLLGILQQKL